VIPRFKCKEVAYLITLTGLLVMRTIMSIWLSDVNGNIVKAIVAKNLPDFVKRVIKYLIISIDFYIDAICYSLISSQCRS
jgi:ATP-binding cassette subfamily D (ALD) protein 3